MLLATLARGRAAAVVAARTGYGELIALSFTNNNSPAGSSSSCTNGNNGNTPSPISNTSPSFRYSPYAIPVTSTTSTANPQQLAAMAMHNHPLALASVNPFQLATAAGTQLLHPMQLNNSAASSYLAAAFGMGQTAFSDLQMLAAGGKMQGTAVAAAAGAMRGAGGGAGGLVSAGQGIPPRQHQERLDLIEFAGNNGFEVTAGL